MSSSSDSGRLSGKVPARLPVKSSSFTQTCSMLSQFLKEKRSFGDLDLDLNLNLNLNANLDDNGTMNLFPLAKESGQVSDASTMDLFPHKLNSSVSKTEAETSQMTIFYRGRVIVFNDFPADKAKEVMLLASKGSSHINTHIQKPVEPTNLIPSTSSSSFVSNIGNNIAQERVQPIVTDLPKIARKASLTRFLEKRKDRITSKAPYYTSSSTSSPPKPAENKSWLGLAPQSLAQFEGQL